MIVDLVGYRDWVQALGAVVLQHYARLDGPERVVLHYHSNPEAICHEANLLILAGWRDLVPREAYRCRTSLRLDISHDPSWHAALRALTVPGLPENPLTAWWAPLVQPDYDGALRDVLAIVAQGTIETIEAQRDGTLTYVEGETLNRVVV